LKKIEWLHSEPWRQLDIHQKVATLNAAGRVLAEVYHLPAPPLLVKDLGAPNRLGDYGDGYQFNTDTEIIEGADYGIQMNRTAETDHGKLFGSDPSVALQTYAHEFRHSYQAEQTLRYQKPQFRNLVDDADEAQAWLHEYIPWHKNFADYLQQPVERDARSFADEVVRRVFG